ncbi:uncharacterized protein EV422DRAFT_516690 [Fimicolochytrium jonesii]|uniref:uncharacterized protein n=1 Tax=Fimicolochytrium jonesii TaxID=1396493 RepID=UPI0022FE8678|nr:uncharacterized protein EV422DRAFT_516690 [Fimicolochytrium jonesii]KAI8824896.1 hypothetical protein EV422DRAFT_516690 [Fimicolochytrium jonesii]
MGGRYRTVNGALDSRLHLRSSEELGGGCRGRFLGWQPSGAVALDPPADSGIPRVSLGAAVFAHGGAPGLVVNGRSRSSGRSRLRGEELAGTPEAGADLWLVLGRPQAAFFANRRGGRSGFGGNGGGCCLRGEELTGASDPGADLGLVLGGPQAAFLASGRAGQRVVGGRRGDRRRRRRARARDARASQGLLAEGLAAALGADAGNGGRAGDGQEGEEDNKDSAHRKKYVLQPAKEGGDWLIGLGMALRSASLNTSRVCCLIPRVCC